MQLIELGKICEMKSGGTPSRKNQEFYKNGNILWAKISDIENSSDGVIYNTEEKITEKALKSINNRIFKEGTLLLAMYGSVGKTAIAGTELSTNQAILGLNITDKNLLNIYYLRYWFLSYKERLLNRAVGGTLQNISKTIVSKLKIPLPSLPEQKRIAHLLDQADKLRQLDKQLIEKYDELTQSLFLEMFGDPVTNPKGWEKDIINNLFVTQSGGTPSKKNKEYWEDGTISWIGSNMCKNTIINSNDGKFITDLGLKKSSAKLFPKGTILVALVGATIGKVGLLNIETSTNQNIAGLIIKDRNIINKIFGFYMMRNLFYKFMEIGDSKFKMANLTFIRNLEFFVPPLSLQTDFSNRVALIERQKTKAQQALQKSDDLFNCLLQQSFKKSTKI